jgi:hypothetical protein
MQVSSSDLLYNSFISQQKTFLDLINKLYTRREKVDIVEKIYSNIYLDIEKINKICKITSHAMLVSINRFIITAYNKANQILNDLSYEEEQYKNAAKIIRKTRNKLYKLILRIKDMDSLLPVKVERIISKYDLRNRSSF